ncbi:hypothetical protein [Burkholderia ubonensis]|uniref:hypothetical protein n=1 Tax=Burkholderia ubonensis TaxID=101571 RepID=UPI000A91C7BF|nr:hypothetical protein [Burkholderia ubonensis]
MQIQSSAPWPASSSQVTLEPNPQVQQVSDARTASGSTEPKAGSISDLFKERRAQTANLSVRIAQERRALTTRYALGNDWTPDFSSIKNVPGSSDEAFEMKVLRSDGEERTIQLDKKVRSSKEIEIFKRPLPRSISISR